MILLIGVFPEYTIQRKVQKLSRLSYAENLIINGKVQNTALSKSILLSRCCVSVVIDVNLGPLDSHAALRQQIFSTNNKHWW